MLARSSARSIMDHYLLIVTTLHAISYVRLSPNVPWHEAAVYVAMSFLPLLVGFCAVGQHSPLTVLDQKFHGIEWLCLYLIAGMRRPWRWLVLESRALEGRTPGIDARRGCGA